MPTAFAPAVLIRFALRRILVSLCILTLGLGVAQAADTVVRPDADAASSAAAIAAANAANNIAASIGASVSNVANATNTAANTAASAATTMASAVAITDLNPQCNQVFAKAYDEAQQKALTVQLSRDNAFFKYQIAGAFAANCVGKLIGYAQSLSDAVGAVQTAATAGTPVQAVITLITHQILNAVFRQLVSNLENQICSITNQVTQAMESVLQNAICVPTGSLGNLNGLFSFNLNLNLPELTCNGIAINPLQLAQVDPATGQPYAMGESNYTSGILADGGLGNYSAGGSSGLTQQRDFYDTAVFENGVDTTSNISGEPNNSFEEADSGLGNTNIVASEPYNGTVACGKGSYDQFLNNLGARESKGCRPSQYQCVNQFGYLGKYQMGEAALKDAGVLISCGGSCFDKNNYSGAVWSSQYGGSYQGFLNSAAAQEAAARAYRQRQWNYLVNNGLTQFIGQTVQGIKITASGLLAAAQLIGAGGPSCGKSRQPCGLWAAMKGYSSGSDAYGTSWKEYATKFGGYDTPFASCQ